MSSAAATAQAILATSQQYTLYVSFIILFFGVFGHVCNIVVFARLKVFQKSPAAYYLTAESIVNLFQLLIPFTSRIAINGFGNDLTLTSLVWCRLRQFITQAFTLTSLSIVTFAAIDQYLSTNFYPYLRQMSTIKAAKILIFTATIVWILHGIPVGFFFEIQSSAGCNIYNQNFTYYVTYVYYVILTGSLPIIVSSCFSALAYHNVRRIVRRQMTIRRRKLDQQLTAMIIARVVFLVVITTPYVLQRIYTLSVIIPKESVVHKAIVSLIGAITISFFYLNYAGSFYIFLISSARFRRQVKNVLINKCWRICCRRGIQSNQVLPMSQFSQSDNESPSG